MINNIGFNYSKHLFQNTPKMAGVERACTRLKQRFPQYIWNDSVTDGKAYTYPLVKTILEGVTVGGNHLSENSDILNQRKSLEKLIHLVRIGQFDLNKNAFCSLHDIAAKEEALEWGVFRSGNVGVAGANYTPPSPQQLDQIFKKGLIYLKSINNTVERGVVFFLFGALHQFFYDVNKRTSRLMMNGILLAGGVDALVIDSNKRFQYNQVMLELYNTKNADAAIQFLLECYRLQDMPINEIA